MYKIRNFIKTLFELHNPRPIAYFTHFRTSISQKAFWVEQVILSRLSKQSQIFRKVLSALEEILPLHSCSAHILWYQRTVPLLLTSLLKKQVDNKMVETVLQQYRTTYSVVHVISKMK